MIIDTGRYLVAYATLLDLVIILKFEREQNISTTTCYYKNDVQILKNLNPQSNLLYGQYWSSPYIINNDILPTLNI